MRLILIFLTVILAAGCAATKPLPPPPSIDEIVQMSADKVPPEEIIRRMREARAVYRLSGSQLADLKLRGVADPVLDYMQHTRIQAERYEEYLYTRDRYMFWGWPGYGPWGPYPYPYRGYHWP
ncbi:MAG TPA: hypothetical protein VJU83_03265 [Burkholderiales bacterium]|nr:hypothetical protein [Burkholderiales bacterium]